MSQFNFNQTPDLDAMKQDIADRQYNIKIKGILISGGLMALAFGAMFLFPGALGAAAPIVALIAASGGTIAGLLTMKETKKLQIDEEFLQSRMSGKNYWGGYREEVMDHGGQPLSAPMLGNQPGQARAK